MRRKKLEENLRAVDVHLKEDESIGADIVEPLQAAMSQVRQTLGEDNAAQADSAQGMHLQAAQSLRQMALQVELNHPKLADLLGHLCDVLSGAGV